MDGKVLMFTGSYGFILGADGEEYFFSRTFITHGRHKLHKGDAVTFTVDDGVPLIGKHKTAVDVQRVLMLKPGHWEWINGAFRCGDCANNSIFPTNYCPHCGKPKERENWSDALKSVMSEDPMTVKGLFYLLHRCPVNDMVVLEDENGKTLDYEVVDVMVGAGTSDGFTFLTVRECDEE